MRATTVIFWVLSAVWAVTGCRPDDPAAGPLPTEPLADTVRAPLLLRWPSTFAVMDPSGRYERVRFDTLLGPCGRDTLPAACTRVVFRYPRFVGSVGGRLQGALNREVAEFLYGDRGRAWTSYVPDPPARFANDATYQWRLRREVEVVRFDSIVGLRLDGYEYTGGAHGLPVRRYVNVDAATGNVLSLDALLSADAQEQLCKLAEDRFRRQQGVAADASLQEAGFWFEEERFFLPENFLAGTDSLYFQYQPYEVGPYAVGMPRVAFAREEIKQLLERTPGF
ncbi:MAG: DUF3298 domain-containing protein [Catalinimonas sp.]